MDIFFGFLGSIITILLALVIVALASGQCLYTVAQQTEVIIERFGKFNRITGPGIHVKIPFVERIAQRVDLRTNQAEFRIDAKTKDNVTVNMSIAAQYHVNCNYGGPNIEDSGVYRSYYMLMDPVVQMKSYIIDALRSAVPSYTLDEVFDKKDSIALDVNQIVAGMMINYGYIIVSTLITSIDLPPAVEQSMNNINSAQRELEAAQSLAEADRVKTVTQAIANAEAMEQAGIGIAKQRKAIADGIAESLETIKKSGVTAEEANKLFLYTQWTDMMSEFARNGQSATVVLSSDFEKTATMLDQMLVAGQTNKPTNPPIIR